jgi:dTDP-4-amino-4,6-dideoxygalactose transaminase
MVDKYSWVDIGSSYLPSELQAAYLIGQLENAHEINEDRLNSWRYYMNFLDQPQLRKKITLPFIPENCFHNAHMFYLKTNNLSDRTLLIQYLKEQGISASFHYVPLHSSEAGKKFSVFNGIDMFTTSESERLLRLPLWYGMKENMLEHVVQSIKDFFLK